MRPLATEIPDRVIVAFEPVEGTDGDIRRCGELSHGGSVVFKRCKPQQDLRFDLPAVGDVDFTLIRNPLANAEVIDALTQSIVGRTINRQT